MQNNNYIAKIIITSCDHNRISPVISSKIYHRIMCLCSVLIHNLKKKQSDKLNKAIQGNQKESVRHMVLREEEVKNLCMFFNYILPKCLSFNSFKYLLGDGYSAFNLFSFHNLLFHNLKGQLTILTDSHKFYLLAALHNLKGELTKTQYVFCKISSNHSIFLIFVRFILPCPHYISVQFDNCCCSRL